MPKERLEKQTSCYRLDNISQFARIEKRMVTEIVKRTLEDGTIQEREEQVEKEALILEGYPIVFNTITHIGGDWGWDERIDPQALEGANIDDCCLKYNHESVSPVMARIRNGSLTLKADNHGVFMHAELLEDDRHFYNRVKAGLIDQMSFAFTVKEQEVDWSNETPLVTIKRIDRLFDVALVDNGAYPTTSINARGKVLAEAKTLFDAEAEKRALEAVETANRLKEEEERKQKEAFEFRKRKEQEKLRLGGIYRE